MLPDRHFCVTLDRQQHSVTYILWVVSAPHWFAILWISYTQIHSYHGTGIQLSFWFCQVRLMRFSFWLKNLLPFFHRNGNLPVLFICALIWIQCIAGLQIWQFWNWNSFPLINCFLNFWAWIQTAPTHCSIPSKTSLIKVLRKKYLFSEVEYHASTHRKHQRNTSYTAAFFI